MIGRFHRNRRLIAHYYMAIGLVTLLAWWWIRKEEVVDAKILIMLAVYVLVFPVVILYTRKYAVHIFLFLLALITGFYSFYNYSVEEHSILNALYFTFQLFVLVVSDVFTEDGSSLPYYPWSVEIARWSAALYIISTLFIAMYRLLETSILLVYYQTIGNHYVVFGYNENSIAFIEDLRKKKKRVILVADNMSNEVVDYLENLKVVVLNHRSNEENIYVKCGLARAKTIVLLHKEDVDNLNELMDIQHDFIKHGKSNPGLTVYIHLQDVISRNLFLDLESMAVEGNRYFQVKPINLYNLFVDDLFEKYPIYKTEQDDTPVHLLIIGFGPLGQHIALKAATQSGQFEKNAPHITAIDKSMPKIKQEWQRNYPEINERINISLRTFDVEAEQLNTIIYSQETPITHVYVCLHGDNLDLWAGIELSNQFPYIPIYLEFSGGSVAEKWVQSDVSGTRLIYGTGTFREILTEERLLN